MDSDKLPDVLDFLRQAPPFSAIEEQMLPLVASMMTIHYFPKGLHSGLLAKRKLHWLRSGAAQIKSFDGMILDHLDTTGCFGALLQGTPVDAEVEIIEDALIYSIDESHILSLVDKLPILKQFISDRGPRYLQHKNQAQPTSLLHVPVGELLNRDVIAVSPDATVQKAAELMAMERVSSLAVVKDQRLQGILTDKDLRSRVLAKGLGCDVLVADVMTSPVKTIEATFEAMDAMMLMAEAHIHHMPVMQDGTIIGMISASDLMELQRASPLVLAGEIAKQHDLSALVRSASRVPELFNHMLTSGIHPERIGQVLTSVADGFTRRLLQLAEAIFGPPPFAYCWLVFGSHARYELTLLSDQDNALLLAESAIGEDAVYFEVLSQWVCDGLVQCGLRDCPGYIMASNEVYRLSYRQWKNRMSGWIDEPAPQALLNAGIFFDWRAVAGEQGLAEDLQQRFLQEAAKNQLFQMNLARNALTSKPPLGMFGRLVLERSGSGAKGIDLKRRGLVPIIDLARVYAMAGSMRCTATIERLKEAGNQLLLAPEDAKNLIEAFRFLTRIRYRLHSHQGKGLVDDSHNLQPHQLSALERHQLKDCFELVARAQSALVIKFAGGQW